VIKARAALNWYPPALNGSGVALEIAFSRAVTGVIVKDEPLQAPAESLRSSVTCNGLAGSLEG
jgi:hypothetical protein